MYWVFTCLFLLVIVVRLFDIQILDRSNLKNSAFRQYKYEVSLPPDRGSIVDRNYKILAMNIPAVDVIVNPKLVKDPSRVAVSLAQLFGKSASFFGKKLSEDGTFVYVARQQPVTIMQKIEDLGVEGLECQTGHLRKYPKERAGCQIVGFTGIDNAGLSGVELACENILKGSPGRAVLQRTATSQTFVRAEYPVVPPDNGNDIVLTIDYRYQRIAEAELRKTILEDKADSGMVVLMNPNNGQILAMAGEPSFDPNEAGKYNAASWRLRAVTDMYEPGSSFKVVLMSALLNEKLHTPDDSVFCENGAWDVYGETIKDTHPYGWLNLRQVIVKSSNIGMAKLAKDTDNAIFYDYAHAFGFGNKPGTDLIGETKGNLKEPKNWSGMTPLAMAFGHEIAASPIQMCNLFATIANGGVLYQPQIIKEVRKDGGVIKSFSPRSIRRVIKTSTADTLTSFLREAVTDGTGKKADIPGFDLCGKTGTARVALSGGRGYVSRYNSSFGGFFPKDDPQIAMFVMVNNPRVRYYGGDVAAPCFKRIAEQIVALDGLNKKPAEPEAVDTNLVEKSSPEDVPNFLGYSVEFAKKIAASEGFNLSSSGNGNIVVKQNMKDGDTSKEVEILTQAIDLVKNGKKQVPNVKGLPIRNALNLLRSRGIQVNVVGQGRVIDQYPEGGEKISANVQVQLQCESVSKLKVLSL